MANETPTDEEVFTKSEAKRPRKKVPERGRRKRYYPDGDFRIYQIAPADSDMPKGALLPIPGVPGFASTEAAQRWIKNEAGDMLADMQVMVFKIALIANIARRVTPELVVDVKPRTEFGEG